VLTGTTTAGMPTRRFSTAILTGAWPQTDPADCHALATVQQRKAVDLLDNAEDIRSAATQVAATQSGSTVEAFHGTGHELASTITGHADAYFAMARTSTACGQILSGLRDDLDQIDAQAHQHIEPLMRSNNPAARAAAIQIIATARVQAAATCTAAATAITTEGTKSGLGPSSSVQAAGYGHAGSGAPTVQPASFGVGGMGGIKQDTPTPQPNVTSGGDPAVNMPPRPNGPQVINLGAQADAKEAAKHDCSVLDITKYTGETLGGAVGIGAALAAEAPSAGTSTAAVLAGGSAIIDGMQNLGNCK
jgi:hypothetical protein